MGDYFLGWVEVLSFILGIDLRGFVSLVCYLCKFFIIFSVLEEFWSDGGL